MNVSLQALVGKLDDACRGALEAAAGLCLTRTNYDVDLEHLFLKLTEMSDGDIAYILRHYQIDSSRLARDLTRALDRLKTGNARTPALSPRIPKLVQDAWLMASVDYGTPKVRSGHLLAALLADDDLAPIARDISHEFASISLESLRRDFSKITAGSAEDKTVSVPARGSEEKPTAGSRALDQYTV
ncbi:MAG: Clp protease N-terminal domain-containing protein, partial [Terriglobia bacterium]